MFELMDVLFTVQLTQAAAVSAVSRTRQNDLSDETVTVRSAQLLSCQLQLQM